jgi:diguanylate cyclase (GGDEF)-like protein
MESASKNMPLNGWPQMFEDIYFYSQNAERDQYQIFAHLSEVVVGFHKAVDERNYPLATTLIAKVFSWFCALLKALGEKSLADAVFQKYPRLCPRCRGETCRCNSAAVAKIDAAWLHQEAARRSNNMPGSLHDWQKMFDRIYDESGRVAGLAPGSPEAWSRLERAATKLIWELAEVAEAMRQPLYPENLRAELADVFAWQCAIVNALPGAFGAGAPLSFSEVVWRRYPNECDTCLNAICICQLKPMRELLRNSTGIDVPSVHDPLTGLFHRGKFDSDFARAAHRDEPVAVLMLDCDNFKTVNDVGGHDFGDEVLKYVGSAIRSIVVDHGRAYRFGGDEFIILLYGLTPEQVDEIAVGIRDAVRNGDAPRPESGVVAVGVTVGIASQDGGADQALFKAADRALYEAKERRGSVVAHKSRVVAPSPFLDELTGLFHRGQFDSDFARAADRDERMAMLILDCDQFKRLNDTWGPSFGDEILKYVSNAIRSAVADSGRAYRYGSDKFVVLLSGLAAERADKIAVGIRDAVREGEPPQPESGKEVEVGVTIGIAVQSGAGLFDAADCGLNAAKEAGRWSVAYADRVIAPPPFLDQLTGLFHRGQFDSDFKKVTNRDDGVAVLLLDCDRFKRLNDTWGHDFGDEVLKYVGSVLRSVVLDQGRAYRYGGDEFVVLLYGLPPGKVDEIAVRIRDTVANGDRPRPAPGEEVAVGVTIGLAAQNGGADQALFEAADRALYEAKEAGRGSIAYPDRVVAPPPGS